MNHTAERATAEREEEIHPAEKATAEGNRRTTLGLAKGFCGLVGFLLMGFLAGCAGHPSLPPPGPASPFSELHLLTMPMALNLDQAPGADGFAVKVFAVSPKNPKPVAILEGTLEILMFDGTVNESSPKLAPLRTWEFQPDALKPFAAETSIGVGYNLTLRWDNDHPKERRITVLARYRAKDGSLVYSARSSLAVVDI